MTRNNVLPDNVDESAYEGEYILIKYPYTKEANIIEHNKDESKIIIIANTKYKRFSRSNLMIIYIFKKGEYSY